MDIFEKQFRMELVDSLTEIKGEMIVLLNKRDYETGMCFMGKGSPEKVQEIKDEIDRLRIRKGDIEAMLEIQF